MLKKVKLLLLIFMISIFGNKLNANYDKLAYDFNFKDLDGSSLNLSEYKGKVIVVVNVASQCGFTNQYEDMQNIWVKYAVKAESRTFDGVALLKHALVNTTPDITKKVEIDGKEVKVKDMEAIQMANTKIDEIRTAFTDWLHAQSNEFKKRLTDQYNDKFN